MIQTIVLTVKVEVVNASVHQGTRGCFMFPSTSGFLVYSKPLGALATVMRWLTHLVLHYIGPIRLRQLSAVALLAP